MVIAPAAVLPSRMAEFPSGVPKKVPLLVSVPPWIVVLPSNCTVLPALAVIVPPPALLTVTPSKYRVPPLLASNIPVLVRPPVMLSRVKVWPDTLALMVASFTTVKPLNPMIPAP